MVDFNQERVLDELAKGDRLAMDELFDYYYPRLFRFAKSILKIEDGIDDILQEVFIRIWQNRANIKTSLSFNSYIFTVTRNLLLNELRSRLNDHKLKEKIGQLAISPEYHLSDQINFAELKTHVEILVGQLPPKQKEVFFLSRNEGMSHKEIAEKLNISEKTVEYHISHSTRFLKEKLKDFGLISLLYLYLFL